MQLEDRILEEYSTWMARGHLPSGMACNMFYTSIFLNNTSNWDLVPEPELISKYRTMLEFQGWKGYCG